MTWRLVLGLVCAAAMSAGCASTAPARASRRHEARRAASSESERDDTPRAAGTGAGESENTVAGTGDGRRAAGAIESRRAATETEVLEGRASYYADRFHGRPTASGEPYDMHALTAASRDLPFGTVVRVVRVETGASVVVRVNDRGPFRDHSRILDLSRAAAEALDMTRAGVVEIRAEILERGDGRRWRAPD